MLFFTFSLFVLNLYKRPSYFPPNKNFTSIATSFLGQLGVFFHQFGNTCLCNLEIGQKYHRFVDIGGE